MSDQVVKTQRLNWVDDAKGLGIIFIILLHGMFSFEMTYAYLIQNTIMPMFFFLSGWL